MRIKDTAVTAERPVRTFKKNPAWEFVRDSDAELPCFFLKLNMFMIVFRSGTVRCQSAEMPRTVYVRFSND